MVSDPETFNQYQQRRLRIACRHLDGLLSAIEKILGSSASRTPFPKYISDIPLAQRKRLEAGIARMRVQLLHVLESQGIEVEPPSISAAYAIHSAMTFAQIAVEELAPKHMRGYGEISQRAAAELNDIVTRLPEQIAELDGLVDDGTGAEREGEQPDEI
ncbi:MAG: hypothetical protein LAO06_08330 [Acidobacteriia bacterium]|nr:hypothetical protein [Terriglobia bacterium]